MKLKMTEGVFTSLPHSTRLILFNLLSRLLLSVITDTVFIQPVHCTVHLYIPLVLVSDDGGNKYIMQKLFFSM